MTPDVPCLGCGERSAGCHAKCRKYIAYKRAWDAEAARQRKQAASWDLREMENARTNRITHLRNKHAGA